MNVFDCWIGLTAEKEAGGQHVTGDRDEIGSGRQNGVPFGFRCQMTTDMLRQVIAAHKSPATEATGKLFLASVSPLSGDRDK